MTLPELIDERKVLEDEIEWMRDRLTLVNNEIGSRSPRKERPEKEKKLTIKQFRLMRNLSQKYMAKKLDITQGEYSKIENGKRKISLTYYDILSKELGFKREEVQL